MVPQPGSWGISILYEFAGARPSPPSWLTIARIETLFGPSLRSPGRRSQMPGPRYVILRLCAYSPGGFRGTRRSHETQEGPFRHMNLINLIRAGGWTMVPILIASLVTVALIIEHAWSLARAKKHLSWLWQYPEKKDQLLLKKPNDVVTQYLAEVEEGQVTRREDKEHLASQLILAQERRIAWLGTIAAIAPLLGLIGTVSGMIIIFFQISAAPPSNPLAELSRGISEALVATAGGLIVAIVAAIAHHFLMNGNDDLAMDMEAWLKDTDAAAAPGGMPLAHQAK